MRTHTQIVLAFLLILIAPVLSATDLPPQTAPAPTPAKVSNVSAQPEAGTNLVNNNGFDTDLASWNPVLSNPTWSPIDASNSSSSGSAVLYNTLSPEFAADLRQCFTGIIPGRQYQWGGKARIPSGQSTSGWAYMYLVWVSDLSGFNNCDGHLQVDPGAVVHSGSVPLDTFVALDAGTVTAPVGAVGAQISFNIQKEQAGGEFRYHADDPYLIDVSAPVLTIRGTNLGLAGRPLSFDVSAVGCAPGDLNWNWSASGGASIIGGNTRTATFTWPSSGGFNVGVSNSDCGGASTGTTVSISTLPASVVLTSPPKGMIQGIKETDSFTLSNLGGTITIVTMVSDPGNLIQLKHVPEAFSLPPGESQAIEVSFEGGLLKQKEPEAIGLFLLVDSIPTGAGVPSDLKIPITQLLTSDPGGSVTPTVDASRLDVVADPSILRYDTSIRYTNEGTGTLQALLVPSATWIDAGLLPSITLNPGESDDVVLHIDRSKRPDASAPLGSVASELSLVYLDQFGKARTTSNGSSATLATAIVDTARPATAAGAITPLSLDEVALFLPGIGHRQESEGLFLSDVSITNTAPSGIITDLQMFYLPMGGTTATQTSVPSVESGSPLALADVVKQTFSAEGQSGTLHLRTATPENISAVANVFNSSNPLGTEGTSIPLFRSDRSAGVADDSDTADRIYITGLRKNASSHSDLYLQEVTGVPVSVTIEYKDAAGNTVGSGAESLTAFGFIQRSDVVPAGSVSVIITVDKPGDESTPGRIIAFATPVDRASGDSWTLTDWGMFYGYGGGEATMIPVSGSVRGVNQTHFRTDVAVMNTGTSSTSVTINYYGRDGNRVENSLNLSANQSQSLEDVVGNFLGISGDTVGAIVVTPAAGGSVAVTSRTFTTLEGHLGTYGTGVPTLAVSAALRPGDVKRIGGLEDSTSATISAGRPASFRTNFGLVETAGSNAVIRATLKYTAVSGSTAAAAVTGQASKEYTLAGNQLLLLSNIAREILGTSRESQFGELRNLQVEFQVLSGRAHIFVSSTDNGTGESRLRTE